MTDNQLVAVHALHDAYIGLQTTQRSIEEALAAVQQALQDGPFYVSVANEAVWAGSDGVYVDIGTFDGKHESSERLSHYVLPLPDTVDDLVANLAELVSALAEDAAEG